MNTNTLLICLFALALFASAVGAVALIVKRAIVALRPNRKLVILPMSTGVPILPTQSAQITGRPQRRGFRPERLFISNAGTGGGAADWIVNDIKIGNQTQFIQSGDVPGDMFASNANDALMSFDVAPRGDDVVLVVTYIGLNKEGCPFFASFIGEGIGPVLNSKPKLQLVPDERKQAA